MAAQWRQLLQTLAELAPGTVAYWRMKNGAEFHFAIPRWDDIDEQMFSPEIEFPFAYHDIDSLTIQATVGHTRLGIANNLRAVRRAISLTDGFICDELPNELIVHPADEDGEGENIAGGNGDHV